MPNGNGVNILVIGKGGREHALVWKLKQSQRAGNVFCAPGNAGTASDGATNVAIEHTETDRLARFCAKEQIDLVVIGPEDPLAAGLANFLRGRTARRTRTDTRRYDFDNYRDRPRFHLIV